MSDFDRRYVALKNNYTTEKLNEFMEALKKESGKKPPNHAKIAGANFYIAGIIRNSIVLPNSRTEIWQKTPQEKGFRQEMSDRIMPYAFMAIDFYEKYFCCERERAKKANDGVVPEEAETRGNDAIGMYYHVIINLLHKYDLGKALEMIASLVRCIRDNGIGVSGKYKAKTMGMIKEIKAFLDENGKFFIYKYGPSGVRRMRETVQKLECLYNRVVQ
ncbi:MAG: hypothetical protein LBI86_00985 [Treponema sp.]|jgi:hypothetical protein|nr:hypothetical protein [Treponema sp.]